MSTFWIKLPLILKVHPRISLFNLNILLLFRYCDNCLDLRVSKSHILRRELLLILQVIVQKGEIQHCSRKILYSPSQGN